MFTTLDNIEAELQEQLCLIEIMPEKYGNIIVRYEDLLSDTKICIGRRVQQPLWRIRFWMMTMTIPVKMHITMMMVKRTKMKIWKLTVSTEKRRAARKRAFFKRASRLQIIIAKPAVKS